MSTIDPEATLNEPVAAEPRALPVLHRYGLDTCYGDALPLREAARRHELSLDELLAVHVVLVNGGLIGLAVALAAQGAGPYVALFGVVEAERPAVRITTSPARSWRLGTRIARRSCSRSRFGRGSA